MDSRFLPEKDRSYRVQVLRDNCERVETFTHRKALDDADLTMRKDAVIQKIFEITRKDLMKKEQATQFNKEIKELKKERDKHLAEISLSSIEVTEDVFLIADHDDQRMGYYNADGDLLHSRPLTQEERQGRMRFLKASNDE